MCTFHLQGIRTGRLPIGAHMQLATSKVLTVNQVCWRGLGARCVRRLQHMHAASTCQNHEWSKPALSSLCTWHCSDVM